MQGAGLHRDFVPESEVFSFQLNAHFHTSSPCLLVEDKNGTTENGLVF